jgi:Ca2+-transporting ATPase
MADDFAVDSATLFGLLDQGTWHRTLSTLGGDASELAKLLRSDVEHGLNESKRDTRYRAKVFGENKLSPPDEVTFIELIKGAFSDYVILLLIVSAVVSVILGFTVADPRTGRVNYEYGWIEGTVILASVCVITVVKSVVDFLNKRKFKELAAAVRPPARVKVTRAGLIVEVREDTLLVGDVVHLVRGMICPADAVFIQGQGIKMDESAATGESEAVRKDATKDPIFCSGTYVLEGEATALVVCVGDQSLAGRIALAVRSEKHQRQDTPLQESLDDLANVIGRFGATAAALMLVVLCVKEFFTVQSQPFLDIKKFLDVITTSLALVVVAVPDGMPRSVSITLAFAVKPLLRENILLRDLAACETMGVVTSICTDKTGILTRNELHVTRGYLAGSHFEFNGDLLHDRDVVRTQIEARASIGLLDVLCESISLNSTAPPSGSPAGVSRYVGYESEKALFLFVEKLGASPLTLARRVAQKNRRVYPVTSGKKTMTTCVRAAPADGSSTTVRYCVKGASETVLAACHSWHNGEDVEEISGTKRGELLDSISEYAENGLRALVIAYADEVNAPPQFADKEPDWPPLTFLALIGIEDPIRPEVAGEVERCKTAGIAVRMVTGDIKAVAMAVAKKAGIYGTVYWGTAAGQQGLAMEGSAFRQLAQHPRELSRILPRLQVLAHATPLDKYILVNALKERGEVVAVTGDGAGDAPALKNANVGLATNTATEVAKQAAGVIILDGHFKSIVTAIKYGRNVHDNVSKLVQFQTTAIVAAVVIAFIGAVTSDSSEARLKPVQLLWISLVMDPLAALALVTERPTAAALQRLDRPPRRRDAPLITRRMWVNIAGQAVYQVGLQLWLLNRGFEWFNVRPNSEEHLTVVFNVFVLLQVANAFNARVLHKGTSPPFGVGLHCTPCFAAIVMITVAVQYIGVTYLGTFMQCKPLTPELWMRSVLVSLVPLLLDVVLRLIPVAEPEVPIGKAVDDEEDESKGIN